MTQPPDNIVPITSGALSAAQEFGAEHDRELLTILFTDLVDSTKLQQESGNFEAARLTELHRAIVRDELAKYDAREIEWAGDSCLAVFTMPSDAVIFALQMLRAHRRMRLQEPELPHFRVGIHLGEIVVKRRGPREDLFGLQVSVTARIMSIARGDQICCTRAVYDNSRSSLKNDSRPNFESLAWAIHGQYRLKGLEDPVEICEVGEREFAPMALPEENEKCQRVQERPVLTRMAALTLAAVASLAALFVWLGFGALREETLRSGSDLAVNQTNRMPAPLPKPVKRYSISLPSDQAVADPGITSYSVAFSPDGNRLAYVADRGDSKILALRNLDRLGAELLAGTEGARNPFFSPDGLWIGFFTQPGGQLKKVSVRGGAPIALCSAPLPLGAFWSTDGFITFASRIGAGLMRVPDSGGTADPLTTLDTETGEIVHMFPAPLPNENALIITTGTAPDIARAQVEVLALDTGERTLIAKQAVRGHYIPTGHIVYAQEGSFMAVPFSTDTLEITGPPFDITEERMATDDWPPRQYTLSANGSLAYVPRDAAMPVVRTLLWVDRKGQEEIISAPPRQFYQARLSPDNSRIAFGFAQSDDIWIFDLERGTNRRFTFDAANDSDPVWSPDGHTLAFSSSRDIQFNIYTKNVDGSAEPERVFKSDQIIHPRSWSSDGKFILYQTQHAVTGWDIGMVAVNGAREPIPLRATLHAEWHAAVSFDTRWVAYISDESGQFEVFVQGLHDSDQRKQVSPAGGTQPLWNPEKNELFYRDGTHVLAVDIEPGDALVASPPRVLFEDTFYERRNTRTLRYDVSRDGSRFIFIGEPDETESRAHAKGTELILVENWTENFKEHRSIP